MKKVGFVLFIFSITFFLACSIGNLKKEDIPDWLSKVSPEAPPEIDVSGKWHDPNGNYVFGWGEGYLQQQQDSISGAIGSYMVEGRVSGKRVILVFLSGGRVYYTARLDMSDDGVLRGSYFDADDKKQTGGYPTAFARKKDQ